MIVREGFLSGKLGHELARRTQKENVQTEHKVMATNFNALGCESMILSLWENYFGSFHYTEMLVRENSTLIYLGILIFFFVGFQKGF